MQSRDTSVLSGLLGALDPVQAPWGTSSPCLVPGRESGQKRGPSMVLWRHDWHGPGLCAAPWVAGSSQVNALSWMSDRLTRVLGNLVLLSRPGDGARHAHRPSAFPCTVGEAAGQHGLHGIGSALQGSSRTNAVLRVQSRCECGPGSVTRMQGHHSISHHNVLLKAVVPAPACLVSKGSKQSGWGSLDTGLA